MIICRCSFAIRIGNARSPNSQREEEKAEGEKKNDDGIDRDSGR